MESLIVRVRKSKRKQYYGIWKGILPTLLYQILQMYWNLTDRWLNAATTNS